MATSRDRRHSWATAAVWAAATLAGCGGADDPDGSGAGGSGGAGAAKCEGDDKGALGLDRKPVMDVQASQKSLTTNETLVLATGALPKGEVIDTAFTLRNSAQVNAARELRIEKVELLYDKPEGASDDGAPFACTVETAGGEVACDQAPVFSVVPTGADAAFCTSGTRVDAVVVHVRFVRQADNAVRQALLRIRAPGDDRYKTTPFATKLTTKAGTPNLKLSPEILDYGVVKLGACGSKKLSLVNAGDAPVVVTAMDLAPNFPKPVKADIEGKSYQGGSAQTFDPPLEIAPQGSVPVTIDFCPTGPEPFLDVIRVVSNAPGSPHTAKLTANQTVPCLKVVPQKAVNFGFVPLGSPAKRKVSLESCGSSAVEISALALQDDKAGVFTLDTSAIGELGGKPVSSDNLLTIQPNKAVQVDLICMPDSENSDPTSGKPAPFQAKLGIADNTIVADKSLELSCWGTATNCPTPVAISQQGEEIVPQSELQLIGAQSFGGPNQKIVKYAWKVIKQPKGSEVDHLLWPNANAPDPLFGAKLKKVDWDGKEKEVVTVNIAGEYKFSLDVTDDAGVTSCAIAELVVQVIPDEDIHVELLWDTPQDADKLDKGMGLGSDMDLHFSHQNTDNTKICKTLAEMCGAEPCVCLPDLDKDGKVDPFFHSLYDCFWYNANPNWASQSPEIDDNPGLDLDDTDGWGPENLNLKKAEVNVTYTVGVHYWDAHGYGDSEATVRIYILGVLKGEFKSVTMGPCDMWWVKKIAWPSGDLIDIGSPSGKLTKSYYPHFAKALGATCGK